MISVGHLLQDLLEKHRRTFLLEPPVVVVPTFAVQAANKCCPGHGVAPERLQTRESLEGNV